jgi:hypothetical protein
MSGRTNDAYNVGIKLKDSSTLTSRAEDRLARHMANRDACVRETSLVTLCVQNPTVAKDGKALLSTCQGQRALDDVYVDYPPLLGPTTAVPNTVDVHAWQAHG